MARCHAAWPVHKQVSYIHPSTTIHKGKAYRLSRVLLGNLRLGINIIVVVMAGVRLLLTGSELVGDGAVVLCILVSTI